VAEDEPALFDRLAVVVRRPALDPAQKYIGGRAQQDDRVELGVEPALVGHGSGQVQRRPALAREKLRDQILAPDVPADLFTPLTPGWLVGVHRLESASLEFQQRGGLARA